MSRFSKKKYEVIADSLNRVVRMHTLEAVALSPKETVMLDVVIVLEKVFTLDNPNFNRNKFYDRVYNLENKR